jgi:membrane carboxypeptidase/penicillin-binding protein
MLRPQKKQGKGMPAKKKSLGIARAGAKLGLPHFRHYLRRAAGASNALGDAMPTKRLAVPFWVQTAKLWINFQSKRWHSAIMN